MDAASIAVVALVVALAGFAVWRNLRKGAPCACGRSSGECRCSGGCHCR